MFLLVLLQCLSSVFACKCLTDGSHLGLSVCVCFHLFVCHLWRKFVPLAVRHSLDTRVCMRVSSTCCDVVLCWRGTVCFLPSAATPNHSHRTTQSPRLRWPPCPCSPIGHLSPCCWPSHTISPCMHKTARWTNSQLRYRSSRQCSETHMHTKGRGNERNDKRWGARQTSAHGTLQINFIQEGSHWNTERPFCNNSLNKHDVRLDQSFFTH